MKITKKTVKLVEGFTKGFVKNVKNGQENEQNKSNITKELEE